MALGNPEGIEPQHLYRTMDLLLEHEEAIQREVFFATTDLLNLLVPVSVVGVEVDLIFFDTTSSYFELEGEDEGGLRRYGHSKERRGDLPQIVIGLAVTKEGNRCAAGSCRGTPPMLPRWSWSSGTWRCC